MRNVSDLSSKMKKISETLYEIPKECLTMNGTPDQQFDAILAHSPLLKEFWEKDEKEFGEDSVLVKQEIFLFIKELRTKFKETFYKSLKI